MTLSKSIYIIAGELSGDIHGAELMRAVGIEDPEVKFTGYGGGNMKSAGGDGITDWLDKSAVMGVIEVLKQYKFFKQSLESMAADIIENQPEALVLIDYPKFNLMLAERLRKANVKTKIVYYISPKVWAWNKKRVPKMARLLDKMICIFPFEVEIYEKAGLEVEYVGNPLVDELGLRGLDSERDANLIGLFPGSREREVSKLLPVMVEAAVKLDKKHAERSLRFVIPSASEKLTQTITQILESFDLDRKDMITVTQGESQQLMRKAYCGVVASGTATLEAAWLGLPYCLIYKLAPLTFLIAQLVVKIEFIGLVNILAGRGIVEELIQDEASAENIGSALDKMLRDNSHRNVLLENMISTADTLGEPGVHLRAAKSLLNVL